MQSYILMKDARIYTAILKIPPFMGPAAQILQIFVATKGWVFARPIRNALNGYQLTGGIFNHSATVSFPETGYEFTLRQKFLGLDVFDQLRVEADIIGTLPELPSAKVTINEYQQQFTLTAPGLIQSLSSHEVIVELDDGKQKVMPYNISQSFSFDYCKYNDVPVGTVWTLKAGKNYITYEAKEQIVRLGLSVKVAPIGGKKMFK